MNSDLLPWHVQTWQQLLRDYRADRLPHALLLSGAAGLGKGVLAQCLAAFLLCRAPTGERVCGKCTGCNLFQAGNHPDFFLLQPSVPSNAIKIEEVRSITNLLEHSPNQNGRRVIIIEQADTMTPAAANALLKTLEEPAAEVFMILTTSHLRLLVATVRSRCQLVSLRPPPYALVADWLQAKVPEGDSELLFRLTEQAPLAAISLGATEFFLSREIFFAQLDALVQDRHSLMQAVEELGKLKLESVVRFLMLGMADLVKLKFALPPCELTNLDHRAQLNSLAKRANLARLFEYVEVLARLYQQQLNRVSLNPTLVLEVLLIQWISLFVCDTV